MAAVLACKLFGLVQNSKSYAKTEQKPASTLFRLIFYFSRTVLNILCSFVPIGTKPRLGGQSSAEKAC